jgi:hypothetical protein
LFIEFNNLESAPLDGAAEWYRHAVYAHAAQAAGARMSLFFNFNSNVSVKF